MLLIILCAVFIDMMMIMTCNAQNCPLPSQFPNGTRGYQIVELGILGNGAADALGGYETPITSRISLAIGTNQWDCYATYTEDVFAVRTFQRPILADTIPSIEYDNSNNQLLCYTYSWVPLIFKITGSYSNDLDFFYTNSWGLRPLNEIIIIQNDIESCGDPNDISNFECLNDIANNYDYCGDVMGIIVGVATNFILSSDGFNDNGNITPFGNCTSNCRPYSDPIGFYDPRINIFNHPNPKFNFIKKNKFPGFTKKNKFKWVNLLEDNGKGFFNRQEHITPHIGYTVDPITISIKEYKDLIDLIDDPDYDYKDEAESVINELAITAENITRKAIIEVMDNKILVASLIQLSHWAFFNPTYEQNVIFETGNRLSEYQGILLSWRAKLKFNLIRPTTIIQSSKYTDDFITTYGGPFSGLKTIRTQDFQPYIRIMPHSEYPSASGCICRMYRDHIDEYISNTYPPQQSLPIIFFPLILILNGEDSKIEPGTGINNITLFWSDASTLYENCRQSRLWGGMHFRESIIASDTLCADIGKGIYDYLQNLLGSTRRRRLQIESSIKNDQNVAQEMFNGFINQLNV